MFNNSGKLHRKVIALQDESADSKFTIEKLNKLIKKLEMKSKLLENEIGICFVVFKISFEIYIILCIPFENFQSC